MERDFTAECYEDFCTLVNQIKDDNWCGVTDWFGDLFLSLKHLLQDWGWLDRTTEMETYYKELLDRKDASETSIKQVFEDMSALDISAAEGSHFGYFMNQLNKYSRCLDYASSRAKSGSSGNFSATFYADLIQKEMGEALARLRQSSLPVVPDHQFTSSTFKKLSKEDKQAYIDKCAAICPDLSKKIDQVFSDSDWTDEEKLDIKFMIYSGPEPYRSIYLEHIDQYDISVYQKKSEHGGDSSGSFYSPIEERVYLKDGYFTLRGDPCSPYNTFFHECGHAIDDYERTGDFLSRNFEFDGQVLQDCIVADVRNYVSNVIDNKCSNLNQAQKNQLLTSLNLSDDASFKYGGSTDELPKPLQNYSRQIVSVMEDDLAGETNESPSDVYGGVTNNAIIGDYGHRKNEKNETENYEYYWYRENGNISGKQASELWAEFFAAQMTQDEEALASIKEHFPTAYPLLEEMARQMAPY